MRAFDFTSPDERCPRYRPFLPAGAPGHGGAQVWGGLDALPGRGQVPGAQHGHHLSHLAKRWLGPQSAEGQQEVRSGVLFLSRPSIAVISKCKTMHTANRRVGNIFSFNII